MPPADVHSGRAQWALPESPTAAFNLHCGQAPSGTPVSNLYDGSVSVGDSQHQHAQGATPSRCFHSAECARISMTTLHTAMPSLRSRCHVSHADFTVLESCLPCAQIYQRLSCCRCDHASGACLSLRSSLCNVSEQQEAVEAALCDAESMLDAACDPAERGPRCSTPPRVVVLP